MNISTSMNANTAYGLRTHLTTKRFWGGSVGTLRFRWGRVYIVANKPKHNKPNKPNPRFVKHVVSRLVAPRLVASRLVVSRLVVFCGIKWSIGSIHQLPTHI